MPFCPSCRSEYKAGVRHCSECDVDLVDTLPADESLEEMRDIFVCYDEQLVLRVTEILHEENIEALVRDRSSRAFPTSVGMTAERLIAVSGHQAARARELIETAIQDGVLGTEGELLD